MSLREQILSAPDIETKLETVKKWGDAKLLLKGLTGEQRAAAMASARKGEEIDFELLGYATFIAGVCDPETGEPVFTKDDMSALKKKDWATVNRLSGIVMKLSGIGQGDSEDAEKNS